MRYSFDKLKNDDESWYNVPQMRGHQWAQRSVDEIERIVNKYSKTKEQRLIIEKIFDFDTTDWHYFANMSKKYLKNVLFVLNNLAKLGPLALLWKYEGRSGMWREDVEKVLHVLAYDDNPEAYVNRYSKQYTWLGMGEEEARERVEGLVKGWRSKMRMSKDMERQARLMGRQEKILEKWIETSEGQRYLDRGVVFYDALPNNLRRQLERVKNQETLWSDVERYLGDIAPNPHMRGMRGSDGLERNFVASELLKAAKEMTAEAFDVEDVSVYVSQLKRKIGRLEKTSDGMSSSMNSKGMEMGLKRIENGLNQLIHEAAWFQGEVNKLLRRLG